MHCLFGAGGSGSDHEDAGMTGTHMFGCEGTSPSWPRRRTPYDLTVLLPGNDARATTRPLRSDSRLSD
ncbi:MAG: hypothetical protein OXF02_07380 [Simkaniaceae bacterium]|nr:hypothetical protein [Simkaniaceae bacterium]